MAYRAIVATPDALAEAITALRGGTGPVAVDAERAHGSGTPSAPISSSCAGRAGTYLIDPIALGEPAEFSPELDEAVVEAEWIIHAASQDLRCLLESVCCRRTCSTPSSPPGC